ncbi:glycosyltransferase [Marivirga arenosa]|uniref:Glycosyltransferase n=1 Tax=Marivirga arenosa TaxID=3059076 RepID=A0AA52EZ35_9BACT|nr:glycosyltransferase [Marivirga sp. BKB1-2]WNB17319.1 glycosyltransferase [Marivirga sp. BKB1-2]
MSKKQILFVCPYPTDEAPSQRFRFEQYFKILKSYGYKYDIAPFLTIKAWNILYKNGSSIQKSIWILLSYFKRIALLFFIRKYDRIFIHREASPLGPAFFEWFSVKILKKKIIYDFDDAIWLDDPNEKGSLKAILKWKRKVRSICKWSYKVSAGNQYLADYAKRYNQNVIINPTTIDTGYHENKVIQKENEKITIGWTGTHSTLQYLSPLIPILDQLNQNYDFELLIISNQKPDFNVNYIRFIKWSKTSEIEDLNQIDIGIMPLSDDIWSKGKCGFKMLQYMSINKAVIASPVGVNQKILEESNAGIIASNDSEWINGLKKLLDNNDLRNELGKRGRKYIQNHYSVKSNTENFLKLFD